MSLPPIGFIGGGNMSTAIFRGILKSDDQPPSISVSGPHLENLQHWSSLGAHITTENGKVFIQSKIIFLGVKPHLLNTAIIDCLNTIPSNIPGGWQKKHCLFISMLAGISIAQLQKEIAALTANARIIRIMPNTPMMVGQGACLYTPDDKATEDDCVRLEKLISHCGICERVSEDMMDSLGALGGCGPAFMFVVIEALADGAVKQGVPRALALKFAAQIMLGSGKMILDTGKHPGQLKDEVCSPGGSTICGVTALENGNLRAAFINAIEASTSRNKELGMTKK